MNKILFSVLVLIASIDITAQAQQIDFGDYQTLLREDRVWVNYFDHIDMTWDPDFPEGDDPKYSITYTYELRGDSVVDGIKYKKCYMKRSEKMPFCKSENVKNLKEVDHPVALLREDNMKVYCRLNDYPKDLFNPSIIYDYENYHKENLLYDFAAVRAQVLAGNAVLDKVNLGGTLFNQYTRMHSLIESIGNSKISVLLFEDWIMPACEIYDESAISHVLDKDGNVIFKSKNYRPEPPYSAINDLKVEAAKGDNRYYNLTGQPVSNPSAGIYIHNGKKVIVK